MPNIQEIIKQVQKDLSCPICGKKYELNKIKVRGVFENAFIIQTICEENHITLLITIDAKTKNETNSIKDKNLIESKPISINEVLDFENFLKTFDGNFENLWTKKNS